MLFGGTAKTKVLGKADPEEKKKWHRSKNMKKGLCMTA